MKPPRGAEVRTYSRPSKLKARYLGVPIPVLALLAITGIVAAATLLGPVLGPTSQTVQVVTLSYGTGAGDGVMSPIQYAVVDTINVDAVNSGGVITNAYAVVSIAYTGGCAALSTAGAIADSNGNANQIQVKISGGVLTVVAIPATGATSPCQVNSPTMASLPSGTTTTFVQVQYEWLKAPTPNPTSWSFQAAQ